MSAPKVERMRRVYRCAACEAEAHAAWVSAGEFSKMAPPPVGWEALSCDILVEAVRALPRLPVVHWVYWLCPSCAATPDESRALAVLRHPIRLRSTDG